MSASATFALVPEVLKTRPFYWRGSDEYAEKGSIWLSQREQDAVLGEAVAWACLGIPRGTSGMELTIFG